MSLASKIINILILIAAIGAVVCAFLLWQKREQITKGREMLSEAIVQAVDKIGPKGQVKKDALSIKLEADKLKDPIAILQKNITKICKQRDEIAAAYAAVVNEVNTLSTSLEKKAALDASAVADYEKSESQRTVGNAIVADTVKYYKERNEKIKAALKELSNALKLSPLSDTDFLDNAKVDGKLREQVKRANDFSNRFRKYADHIIACSDKLQSALSGDDVKVARPNLSLDNASWESDLAANREDVAKVSAKIKELRNVMEALKKENDSLKSQITEKENEIKQRDEKIASLEKNLTDANKEIKRLKKIIDPNSDEDGEAGDATVKQADNSTLKKIVGKITYVNPKYGFVTIDLGSKSTIKGMGLEGKLIDKPAALPEGAIMTVATSLEPGDAKYIARICVARLGTRSSIANVLPLAGSEKPEVGNIVFFSDSDIAQMQMIRDQAMKQAAEESAREKAKAAAEAIRAGGDDEAKSKDAVKKDAEKEDEEKDEEEDGASSESESTEEKE